ncbi:MAG: sialidase family protein, partial [Planctomycetota bacterium]
PGMRLLMLLAPAVCSDPIPVARLFVDGPAAQPAVAVAPDGRVHVAAVRERRVWVVGSTGPVAESGTGLSWSAPVLLAPELPVPGAMRRGPRIAVGKGAIVVTCPTAGRGESEGNLVSFRSTDGGKAWSAPIPVNDQPRSAGEGFHDLAALPDGELFVAWLDGRMNPRGQEIWLARSKDGGETWSRNVRAFAPPERTVCECCPISVAAGADGRVGIVFRHSLAGARDPYLLLSKREGRSFGSPVKLGRGTWRIAVCPMMEGALAFSGDSVVCLAGREGRLELVRPGTWEKTLGAGSHPAMGTGKDRLFFAYREGDSGPLLLGSTSLNGDVESLSLAPPPAGFSRDFPAFCSGAGRAALVFEEGEGNAPPRVGLALLETRGGS